jgi:hypothetical protein
MDVFVRLHVSQHPVVRCASRSLRRLLRMIGRSKEWVGYGSVDGFVRLFG